MIPRKILKEEKLDELYNQQKLSLRVTGRELNASVSCVKSNMKYYDIRIRTQSEGDIEKKEHWRKHLTCDDIIERYVFQELSLSETSSDLNVSPSTLRKYMHLYNIPIRSQKEGNDIRIKKSMERISEKISMKQKYISSNDNLENYDYARCGTSSEGTIRWILKSYQKENIYKFRKNHKKEYDYYQKRWWSEHRIEMNSKRCLYHKSNKKHFQEYRKKWLATPEGRLYHSRNNHKRREKGFIPLNAPLNIDFDWYRIHRDLPFVIAVNRGTHQKYNDYKNHCDLVNADVNLEILKDDKSAISSKEFIEAKVEIHYPEQFKAYWFGEY